jgi:hypothetical protein
LADKAPQISGSQATQEDIDKFRSGLQPLAEAGKLGAPGVKKGFAFFTITRAPTRRPTPSCFVRNLGLKLKAMPAEAMLLAKFPQLVNVESSSSEQT